MRAALVRLADRLIYNAIFHSFAHTKNNIVKNLRFSNGFATVRLRPNSKRINVGSVN